MFFSPEVPLGNSICCPTGNRSLLSQNRAVARLMLRVTKEGFRCHDQTRQSPVFTFPHTRCFIVTFSLPQDCRPQGIHASDYSPPSVYAPDGGQR
jgi:hypothetical protein